MAKQPRTAPATPPLILEDPGITWEAILGGLRIERTLTPLAIVRSVAWLAGTWLVVWLVRDAATFWPFLFVWGFAVLFSIYWIVMLGARARLDIHPDHAEWAYAMPRHFEGSWKKRIHAVKLVRGPRPVRWGSRRDWSLQVKADNDRVELVSGHGEGKAKRLASDLAAALGRPLVEEQATYVPDVGGLVKGWRRRHGRGAEPDDEAQADDAAHAPGGEKADKDDR